MSMVNVDFIKHTKIHTQEKETLIFRFGITVLSLYKLVNIQGKIYSKHRVRVKIKEEGANSVSV